MVAVSEDIRYEMENLHDRVSKLKHVVPPEPTLLKPCWKFWGG